MIKHIELANKDGKILRGYLDMPENFNGEIVVFFHGFTGNKTEHAGHFRNISRIMSKEGFASLRMDFSGNGESDGEFSDFTMDTIMDEAKQMIDFAIDYPNVKKVDILGFSMGGCIAGMLSGIYQNIINKVILWSPAGNINEIIKKYYESGIKLDNGNSMHDYFELSKEMYESTNHYQEFKDIEKYTNPVLLIHGRADKAVNYLYSMKYSVSYYNSIVHIIDGAEHGYDKIEQGKELYSKTIEFLKHNYIIK